jgi:hypothetical protein
MQFLNLPTYIAFAFVLCCTVYRKYLATTSSVVKLLSFIWLHMPGILINYLVRMGAAVAQLVEALCYKAEGRGFDSRFFIDIILPVALWLWG